MKNYFVHGVGVTAMRAAYKLAQVDVQALPASPDDFIAAGRTDGLLDFNGVDGSWEADLDLTEDVAQQIRELPGVDEVSIIG
ncbi:MAG TPA: hypothetical protein VFZ48_05435 [Candidatus Saccharimonadales bacterium]